MSATETLFAKKHHQWHIKSIFRTLILLFDRCCLFLCYVLIDLLIIIYVKIKQRTQNSDEHLLLVKSTNVQPTN